MRNNIVSDLSRLRRQAGSKSLLAFAKIYMKHHLEYELSAAHLEIYRMLEAATAERGRKIAIAAPRYFGKSTMITLIYVVYCICYSKEQFIVIISNTSSQVIQILDNIKKELMENELLKLDFPEIFESGGKLKLLRWRQADIITRNKVLVLALSSGQQIRGRRFGTARPTLVLADDLEDSENTFGVESRDKMKDWYEKSVLKVGSENTNYIFIGNLYHPYSLLSEYVCPDEYPAWIKKVYPAIVTWPKRMDLWDDKWANIYNHKIEFNGASGPVAARQYYQKNKIEMDEGAVLLWDKRYSLDKLMETRQENEFSFLSEFQNTPVNLRDCLFDMDNIVYWDGSGRSVDDLLKSLGDNVRFYGACDPSLGLSTVKGDFSAIVVLAKDEISKTLYIIVADIERRPIEKIVSDILAYHLRYKFVKFGIESNQFQRVLVDLVRKEGEETEIYIPLEAVINKDDKIARIQSLRPRIKSGNLQFSKKHRQLLEEGRYFPKGRHDDGLDALELAVRISNDNGFSFGFAGGPFPIKPDGPTDPIYPTPDGRVPYGWYGGRRPY